MRHISASVASSPMFMTGGKCPYTANTINKVVSSKDGDFPVRYVNVCQRVYHNYGDIKIIITITELLHTMITSSTAQGGGGSFTNRKPIGEVGSCESGMAE